MPSLTPDKARDLLARRGCRQCLEQMTIACRPDPRPFGEVADPWQWEKVLNPLIPAVEFVCGLTTTPPRYRRFWYTLPKGSDKTSVAARVGCFGCNFARRKTGMIVWASDKKQAKLLRDAMSDEKELNPWLPSLYQVDNYLASGPTGFVEINSSDASGGHGTRGSIYVVDEITHWKDKKVWNMVRSSTTKYADTLLIVLGNAGYKDTWQEKIKNNFAEDFLRGGPTYFWEPYGIQASWTDRAEVEAARRDISEEEGQRLYDNVWVHGTSDPAFRAGLVTAMFSLGETYPVPPPGFLGGRE